MPLSEEFDIVETSMEEKLCDGIFNLETIRFGKIPEIMIKRKYGYSFPEGTTKYDLISESGEPVEVKFSCVREKEVDITEENALSVCLENAEICTDRKVKSKDYQNANFDCNIQQVKPDLFKFLYYGLFFEDRIAIFKMNSEDIVVFFTFTPSVRKLEQAKRKLREAKCKIDNPSGGKRSEKYILKRLEDDIPTLLSQVHENLRKIKDYKSKSYAVAKSIIEEEDLLKRISKTIKYISDSSKKLSRRISRCEQLLEILDENLGIDVISDSSAKQHLKSDGEGQFHIKNTNFGWHLNSKYFQEWITYKELYKLLKQ